MEMDKHVIVGGLAWGDEAKGSIVDHLCAGAEPVTAVIRYNGGAQAAHNVVLPDGRHHTFAQFGSGTFRGVPTHLSRHVMVNPLTFLAERGHLTDMGLEPVVTVHGDCLVTTPFHVMANRSRVDVHGTTGMGIGETALWALQDPDAALRIRDLTDQATTLHKLNLLRDRLYGEHQGVTVRLDFMALYKEFLKAVFVVEDDWERDLLRLGPCVFEGAQGVLLDEWVGFHPHTTWSTTTFDNAVDMLVNVGEHDYFCLGVMRAYATRHGAGPLPTEDPTLNLPDPHNTEEYSPAGRFRVGHLDLVALDYALAAAGGADGIALTHVDRADGLKVCRRYRWQGEPWKPALPLGRDLVRQAATTVFLGQVEPELSDPIGGWRSEVETYLGVPVVIESRGPTSDDKKPT